MHTAITSEDIPRYFEESTHGIENRLGRGKTAQNQRIESTNVPAQQRSGRSKSSSIPE